MTEVVARIRRSSLVRRTALALAAAALGTLALAARVSAAETTETFDFTGAAQTPPAGTVCQSDQQPFDPDFR
jgi:hypothetical protein